MPYKDPKKRKAYIKKWKSENPEKSIDQYNKYGKEWKEKNKIWSNAKQKKYADKNRKEIRAIERAVKTVIKEEKILEKDIETIKEAIRRVERIEIRRNE